MAQWCADVVVRSWFGDNAGPSYKSSRVTFIFEADDDIADITSALDELIQEHGNDIQAKYFPGGEVAMQDETVLVSPLVLGLQEC